MGCVTLPCAPGVQWPEGDVYGNQRDSGEPVSTMQTFNWYFTPIV